MRQQFTPNLPLNKANKEQLYTINEILKEYKADGYILTLRQLYYQLVSRDVIANNTKEYGKLSTLLVKGRMAGIVDWAAIEDRGRQPKIPWWTTSVSDAIQTIHDQYRLDRQEGQANYVEVWIEKDALSSIFKRVTDRYHVRLMVNKGYSSCSAMYDAYERFIEAYNNGATKCHILYFGDHDPSGLDMIRDVRDRVSEMLVMGDNRDMVLDKISADLYNVADLDHKDRLVSVDHTVFKDVFEVKQIALNMSQVRKFNPPENPAKITDPRAGWYLEQYGNKSWELDALPPRELARLTEQAIKDIIDYDMYDDVVTRETDHKTTLQRIIDENQEED